VYPIFRWNVERFGFIHRWRLFDSRSYYLGWVDEGEVWRRDGTYLGELVDGCYVLRRRNAAPRSPRVPIEPASSLPAPPSSSSSWTPRPFFKKPTAGSGWEDALDEF
jgi:hypothetical protein